MSARRRIAIAAALVAAGAATTYGAQAQTHRAPAIAFEAPTVVDPFHPGYEPDVTIDKSKGHAGRVYSTWPNGFSTTISYILRSDDYMKSFHPIEANSGAGKALSCPGGGDTDAQVNNHDGELFFADLQGLTNFSNAVSKDGGKTLTFSCTAVPGAGVDRQWIAIDNNGGTASVGGAQGDGRAYFTYDNIEQDGGQNQLVVNQTKDGVNYGGGPGCATPMVNCVLPPAVISKDEGIPGNIAVDTNRKSKFNHTVYVPHVDSGGSGVLIDWCNGGPGISRSAGTVADKCTDPTNFSPNDSHRVNPLWHETTVSKTPGTSLAGFVTMAIDTAGNVYVTWAEFPGGSSPSGPGAVFMAVSKDGGVHFGKPIRLSSPKTPTVVFPWIAAGDPGRVDVVWYGATQGNVAGKFGPDTLNTGTWDVYLAQSTNALSAHPSVALGKVTDHHNKFGNISTQGLGGSPDRSLGDYLQVQSGLHGEAVVTYVDDTSANRNADVCQGCGQTPAEAAGPTMVAVQSSGPSLYASVGNLKGASHPTYNSVTDPVGRATDAFVPLGGQDIAAPAALDIAKVSIAPADAKHLRITMKTADAKLASDLRVSPNLGGATSNWIVRWAAPSYHNAGDGNTFFVGMESTLGQAPSFYTGTTTGIDTTHAKYFVYGHDTAIPGSIKGDTITWTVPLSLIDNPAKGQGLYSVTGFTDTQAGPTAIGPVLPSKGAVVPYSPPNLVDAAPPFTYIVGGAPSHAAGLGGLASGPVAPTVVALAIVVVAGTALAVRGGASRSRRRLRLA